LKYLIYFKFVFSKKKKKKALTYFTLDYFFEKLHFTLEVYLKLPISWNRRIKL
jgi:hypothetical protein